MWCGLDLQAWTAVILTLAIFTTLIATRLPADLAFLGGIIIVLFTGTVDVQTALSGFSDRMVITVGALLVVVAGLESSGVLSWIVRRMLGVPKTRVGAMLRIMLPVAALSSLMSNVTVVSLFVNVVRRWAKGLNIPASKLLIPLSYAATLGGMTLVIGSTANLMVVSIYEEMTHEALSIFTPTIPGLVTVLVGTFAMVFLSRLIPVRRTLDDEVGLGTIVELRIERGNGLVGMTVADAALPLDGEGVRLACIVSYDGEIVRNPSPETVLIPGDSLAFAGDRRQIACLARRLGLKLPPDMEDESGSPVKAVLASLVMAAMVGLSAFRILPLLHCALAAASLMLILRCCSLESARKSFNVPLLMVFAGSVVLGKAVDQTGLAAKLAQGLVSLLGGGNPLIMLIAVSALTSLLTEFISNTACAAVMTPIVIKLAAALGVSPLPFAVSVMLSCSASFATPTGSPTNLLVYGPGGYRFGDFLRVGLPMNVIALAVNVTVVSLVYPF